MVCQETLIVHGGFVEYQTIAAQSLGLIESQVGCMYQLIRGDSIDRKCSDAKADRKTPEGQVTFTWETLRFDRPTNAIANKNRFFFSNPWKD